MTDPFVEGAIDVTHRLVDASNATLLGEIEGFGKVIYKPIAGERPLWDFPTGTLAQREVAAYLLSEYLQMNSVPRTVLRDGPYGPGMVQEWIEIDSNIDVITFGQSKDDRLRTLTLFDAIINNTDRKFGHLLVGLDGVFYGCDHGVTFHHEDKLRTVLWQFAGELFDTKEIEILDFIFAHEQEIFGLLEDLLAPNEIRALFDRANRLRSSGTFPQPSETWPAVPWPPV